MENHSHKRALAALACCSAWHVFGCPSAPSDDGAGGASGTGSQPDTSGASGSSATEEGGGGGTPVAVGGNAGVAGDDTGQDPTEPHGEFLLEVFDSETRYVGKQHLVVADGSAFWVRDADGKLAIFSAELSGAGPFEPQLLFEREWQPSGGWASPPLLVTDTHLVLPTFGLIETGSGLEELAGWTTLRRDGSDVQLARFQNWWVLARGASVVMTDLYTQLTSSVDPGSGGTSDLPNFVGGDQCVYDPERDESGCLWYGRLTAYDFASHQARQIVESDTIYSMSFGSTRMALNATHWFVASAGGLAAYPRAGGGSARYYAAPDVRDEAFVVDAEHIYACIDANITRISLSDESQVALSVGDCAADTGLGSVLGLDDNYVYYIGAPADPTLRGSLGLYRVARTPVLM